MKRFEKINELGFVIQDTVRKTSIIPVLRFLNESQRWSEEEMYSYRLGKLQKLVEHSVTHVPYYRDLFKKAGLLPSDIQSLDDIRKIPILTKEMARENQKRLIAENFSLRHVKVGKTGGTTGVPITIMKDTSDRSFAWASYYRWYNWIGIRKEERVLTFWGSGPVLKPSLRFLVTETLTNIFQNNRTLNSFAMSDKNIHSYYLSVMRLDPVLIKGYVSALIQLARYMHDNNLPPNKSLRAVSGTSETLLPFYRQLLESVFHVPVYDQYGCGEVSAVSYECTAHKGLHINEEHVITETVNELDDPVTGVPGRIIATSLDNLVMPFIRFDNGDIASLLSTKCSCGINSQLMSPVEGRAIDMITLWDGSKVHGVFFTKLFYETGITTDMINRFQLYQYKSGEVDLRLETNSPLSPAVTEKIEKNLLRFLKKINIICVNHIESEENGKFKYIKSEIS